MDPSSSDPVAPSGLVDDLMRLAKAAPPVRDPRPLDELLDYGPDGLPH